MHFCTLLDAILTCLTGTLLNGKIVAADTVKEETNGKIASG